LIILTISHKKLISACSILYFHRNINERPNKKQSVTITSILHSTYPLSKNALKLIILGINYRCKTDKKKKVAGVEKYFVFDEKV